MIPIDSQVQKISEATRVQLDRVQLDLVQGYLQILQKWNKKVSLTTVTDPEELLRLHFFEAFWAAENFIGKGQVITDVGSGAGFPGLAMKIYRPDLEVTLIESKTKKSVFLDSVTRKLGISASVFHGRAEDFTLWNKQELASFRALKPSAQLLELLAQNQVLVLLFHGSDPMIRGLDLWELVERERFPISDNRFVSLYRPRTVSRET